jgi:hypothetical protein
MDISRGRNVPLPSPALGNDRRTPEALFRNRQRPQKHMASDDPDFERKAADVIGLYVNPPQHAAVFCVDEKTAIQAGCRRERLLQPWEHRL